MNSRDVVFRDVLVHAVLLGMVLVSGTALVGVLLALYLQMVLTSIARALLTPDRGSLRKLRELGMWIVVFAFPVVAITLLHGVLLSDAMGHSVVGWLRWKETDPWVAAWSMLWVAFHALVVLLFARRATRPPHDAIRTILKQGTISFVTLTGTMLAMLLLLMLDQIGLKPLYWLWQKIPTFGYEGLVTILVVLARVAISLLVARESPLEYDATGAEKPRAHVPSD